MNYFIYGRNGEQYGPASVSDLNRWLVEGRVDLGMTVEEIGTGVRMPLAQVAGIVVQPNVPPGPSVHQGQYQYAQQSNYVRGSWPSQIDNHLTKAILATLCCCMPVGIVSIIYSAQVESHARRGDTVEAQRLAALADLWANWSIGLGLVATCFWAGGQMLAIGAR